MWKIFLIVVIYSPILSGFPTFELPPDLDFPDFGDFTDFGDLPSLDNEVDFGSKKREKQTACTLFLGHATCDTPRQKLVKKNKPWPHYVKSVEFIDLTAKQIFKYLEDGLGMDVVRIVINDKWEGTVGKIPPKLFKNTPNVKSITIRTLSDQKLPKGLAKALMPLEHLRYLNFDSNPLPCDCDLPNLIMERQLKVKDLRKMRPAKRGCKINGFSHAMMKPAKIMEECALRAKKEASDYEMGFSSNLLADWDIDDYIQDKDDRERWDSSEAQYEEPPPSLTPPEHGEGSIPNEIPMAPGENEVPFGGSETMGEIPIGGPQASEIPAMPTELPWTTTSLTTESATTTSMLTTELTTTPLVTTEITTTPLVTTKLTTTPPVTTKLTTTPPVTTKLTTTPSEEPIFTTTSSEPPDITTTQSWSPELTTTTSELPKITTTTSELPKITTTTAAPEFTTTTSAQPIVTTTPRITTTPSEAPKFTTVQFTTSTRSNAPSQSQETSKPVPSRESTILKFILKSRKEDSQYVYLNKEPPTTLEALVPKFTTTSEQPILTTTPEIITSASVAPKIATVPSTTSKLSSAPSESQEISKPVPSRGSTILKFILKSRQEDSQYVYLNKEPPTTSVEALVPEFTTTTSQQPDLTTTPRITPTPPEAHVASTTSKSPNAPKEPATTVEALVPELTTTTSEQPILTTTSEIMTTASVAPKITNVPSTTSKPSSAPSESQEISKPVPSRGSTILKFILKSRQEDSQYVYLNKEPPTEMYFTTVENPTSSKPAGGPSARPTTSEAQENMNHETTTESQEGQSQSTPSKVSQSPHHMTTSETQVDSHHLTTDYLTTTENWESPRQLTISEPEVYPGQPTTSQTKEIQKATPSKSSTILRFILKTWREDDKYVYLNGDTEKHLTKSEAKLTNAPSEKPKPTTPSESVQIATTPSGVPDLTTKTSEEPQHTTTSSELAQIVTTASYAPELTTMTSEGPKLTTTLSPEITTTPEAPEITTTPHKEPKLTTTRSESPKTITTPSETPKLATTLSEEPKRHPATAKASDILRHPSTTEQTNLSHLNFILKTWREDDKYVYLNGDPKQHLTKMDGHK